MSKKITQAQAFENIAGKEDKFFGEWHFNFTQSLVTFLNAIKNDALFQQIQTLFLYLESLEVLKKEGQKDVSLNNLMSKNIWYCSVLLLLIGLIDQNTKEETNEKGNTKTLGDRFAIVMNCLSANQKKNMLMHYRGENKFKKFEDITPHLYATRNFFAHEIITPEDSVPQDSFLAIDKNRMNLIHLNMPHGQIFLTILSAFIQYLGYANEIEIKSNKKFDNITDLLRVT